MINYRVSSSTNAAGFVLSGLTESQLNKIRLLADMPGLAGITIADVDGTVASVAAAATSTGLSSGQLTALGH